ncbi:MFS transporter [Peribacillus acanthi]|uniref:MFS transporter n=1 Tax=Peribacillus acanthi TaxID=2171554 RepID=UPI000D3EA5DA|nr:MFS transporter [Peribacillus acanthi]
MEKVIDNNHLRKGFTSSVKFILLWNMLFCLGLSVYTVLYNLYLKEIVTINHIGNLVGLSYLSYALFSIVAGFFSMRLGPRYVLLTGILILLTGVVGSVFARSLPLLYFWAFFTGIGQASTNVMFVPLLTQYSKENERVKLFSFAFGTGNVFMFVGTLGSGVIADKITSLYSISSMLSLRMVILSAAGILIVSSIPLLFVKENHPNKNEKVSEEKQKLDRGTIKKLVSYGGIKLFEGIGIGLTIPYFNLFLSDRFEINTTSISIILSIAALGTVVLIFISPRVTKKWGENHPILVYQLIGLLCLAFLCYTKNIILASILILFIRATLFGKAPMQSKIVMGSFPEKVRGLTNSLGSMTLMLGTGGAGFVSTKLVYHLGIDRGYTILFLFSSICIGISAFQFYVIFKSQPITEINTCETHAS